jgi:peptide/nickel transport system permease protein
MVFLLSQVLPADPVALSTGPEATQEQLDELAKKWNLDKPLIVQFVLYLNRLLHGDWGVSIQTRRPVIDDLRIFFPATFELTFFSMLFASLIGTFTGTIAAIRFGKWQDYVVRIYAMLGASVPAFWLGLVLLFVFYFKAGWFPGAGRLDPSLTPPRLITGMYIFDSLLTMNWAVLKSSFMHIILPAATLGFQIAGAVARQARASMMQRMEEPYIKYAIAKGLGEKKVVYKHAMKNALIPVITLVGILYGACLSGVVFVEAIFSWPGVGRYAVRSIMFLDFQPVMGVALLTTFFFILINLIVDVIYSFLDPRIKY